MHIPIIEAGCDDLIDAIAKKQAEKENRLYGNS
jgi:hypothetical protein